MFEVKTNIKQGYCVSPLLFNPIRKVEGLKTGIKLGKKISILAYAYIIVFIGQNEELKSMTQVSFKRGKRNWFRHEYLLLLCAVFLTKRLVITVAKVCLSYTVLISPSWFVRTV